MGGGALRGDKLLSPVTSAAPELVHRKRQCYVFF